MITWIQLEPPGYDILWWTTASAPDYYTRVDSA